MPMPLFVAGLPGAMMPPEAGVTVPPIVPLPPNVAKLATLTAPVDKLPPVLTSSVPPFTLVPPVWPLRPS